MEADFSRCEFIQQLIPHGPLNWVLFQDKAKFQRESRDIVDDSRV